MGKVGTVLVQRKPLAAHSGLYLSLVAFVPLTRFGGSSCVHPRLFCSVASSRSLSLELIHLLASRNLIEDAVKAREASGPLSGVR
jgi:cyanate permease